MYIKGFEDSWNVICWNVQVFYENSTFITNKMYVYLHTHQKLNTRTVFGNGNDLIIWRLQFSTRIKGEIATKKQLQIHTVSLLKFGH